MALNYLTIDDLKGINEVIMKEFKEGNSVIVFPGSLDYCVESVKDLLPANPEEVVAKSAAYYLICLIKNHAFLDVNKRTACVAMLLFLELNGYTFTLDNEKDVQSNLLKIAKFDINLEEVEKW